MRTPRTSHAGALHKIQQATSHFATMTSYRQATIRNTNDTVCPKARRLHLRTPGFQAILPPPPLSVDLYTVQHACMIQHTPSDELPRLLPPMCVLGGGGGTRHENGRNENISSSRSIHQRTNRNSHSFRCRENRLGNSSKGDHGRVILRLTRYRQLLLLLLLRCRSVTPE